MRKNLFHSLVVVLCLAAAVLAIYWPAIDGGFVLDDDLYVTDNPLLRSTSGLRDLWFSVKPADYFPVSNTMLWLEWRLWGMHPTGYHAVNLVLHTIATVLVWLVMKRLAIPGAFVAAMIFAVHPVNVESVAWIAQRKGLLALVFFLLSVLAYLKAEASDAGRMARRIAYALSIAAFTLAMLSKGSVATAPVALLALAWWMRGRLTTRDLLRVAPLFVIAIALSAVNVWFQKHGHQITIRDVDLLQRVLGAAGTVWFYLYKAMLPIRLVFVYPQWDIRADQLLWWLPLAAAVAVTGVLWWYRGRWSRAILAAWIFFVAALLPVMGFADIGYMMHSLVADHYQHVAILAVIVCVAVAWGWWRAKMPALATAVAVLVVGVLAWRAWEQSRLYENAETLYTATLRHNPDSWLALNNLGAAIAQDGRQREAIAHYNRALELRPDYAEAHNNLGIALTVLGKPAEAVPHFEKALQLRSNYALAHDNYGVALTALGKPQQAAAHHQIASELRPGFADAYNNMGMAYASMGRFPDAIAHYEQALRLDPHNSKVHFNLGNARSASGQLPDAIQCYRRALEYSPNDPAIHNNLGIALAQSRLPQEAIVHFQHVTRLDPQSLNGWMNLANAYFTLRRTADGVAAAEKALELAKAAGLNDAIQQIETRLNAIRARRPQP